MKRAHEPIFWSLFAGGGMATALVLPAVLLILVFFLPLHLVDGQAFSYNRILNMSGHWLGQLVWFFVLALPAWHALHRLFHLTQDFKLGRARLFAVLCYGFAGVMTVATLTLLVVIGQ